MVEIKGAVSTLTKQVLQQDRVAIKGMFQSLGAEPFFTWIDGELNSLQERVWQAKSFEEFRELKGTREAFVKLKAFILTCISEG